MGIAGGLSRLEGAVLSSGFLGSVSQTGILPGRGLSVPSFPSPGLPQFPLRPYTFGHRPDGQLGRA